MNPPNPGNSASTIAESQYQNTTKNLERRIEIYKYSTNPQSWLSFVASHISPVLGTSPKILDVGAGTGELWKNVSFTSPADLTLADFSSAMCSKLQDLEIPNAHVNVVQCDAAKIPFEDGSFDILVATHLLHHVESPPACIAEFARVLKPGASVFISAISRDSSVNKLYALSRKIGRTQSAGTFSKHKTESAVEEMERYFRGVRKESYTASLEVPGLEPVLDYLGTLPGGVLTEEERKLATDIVGKEIAENGSFTVYNSVDLVIGINS
jgi:ubiquinone/menaquinone biosynthesis C-methylase UbiE